MVWLDSFSRLLFSVFEHNQIRSSRQSQQPCQALQTTKFYASRVCMLNVLHSYPNSFIPYALAGALNVRATTFLTNVPIQKSLLCSDSYASGRMVGGRALISILPPSFGNPNVTAEDN